MLAVGPWEDRVAHLQERAAVLSAAGLAREAAATLNDAGLAALEGGLLDAAGALFEQVAAAFEAEGRETEASAAQANLALLAMRTGALDEAGVRFRRSLDLLATAAARNGPGDVRSDLQEANVRVNLGVLYRRRNDLEAAADQYERAQQVYRRLERRDDVLDVEANLAVLDDRAGRLGAARRRLEWVRDQLVPGRDDRPRARAATTLAAVAGQEGRFNEAMSLLEEAHATYAALRLPRELADVVTNQGYVLMHTGDLAGARRHLRRAEHLFHRIGMHLDRARVLGGLGSLDLRMGDVWSAVEHFAVALEVYDARNLRREVGGMLVNLGVAHADEKDWASAVQLQQAALEVYAELGPGSDGAAQAEHNLGVAFAGRGEHAAARLHYGRARAAYRRLGRRREAADVTMNLGIAAAATGDLVAARRYYGRAARELRELGVWPALARAVHNLGLTFSPASQARRDQVLPAWLALDAVRFTLSDAAERSRWRDTVGAPGAAAFDSAARHGPLLLAEVIEHARAVGTVDDAVPAPVAGLVDVPGPRGAPPAEVGVRPPVRIDLGWPSTLTPYLDESRTLLPATPARHGQGTAASLVRLLGVAAPHGSEQ